MKFAILVSLCFCSIWASPKSSRIIGGELAAPGQYPYIVGISYKTNSNEEKFCGGTLLNNQWVLTAAYCLQNNLEFKIYLGTTNLEEPGLVVDSASTVLHPDYNSVNLENNVGLLQLFEPIEFTDIIKPIDFLSTERVSDSVRATLLGWGLTSDDDGAAISSDLHHVQLTTITNSDCMLIFSNQIKNTMLCAKGDSNEGVCKGDAGGPLVRTTEEGKHILIGIASFYSGRGCNRADPSGFTRISNYVDWIYTNNIITSKLPSSSTTPDPTGSSAALVSNLLLSITAYIFRKLLV